MSTAPSVDGRRFAGVSSSGDGEVGRATVFDYHESDGLVWAEYSGGDVRLGRLAGTREGDRLSFRYVHVSVDGASSSGRCEARLEVSTTAGSAHTRAGPGSPGRARGRASSRRSRGEREGIPRPQLPVALRAVGRARVGGSDARRSPETGAGLRNIPEGEPDTSGMLDPCSASS